MSAQQFVIMTRYQSHGGRVIRHVYGTWPTRARAKTALRKMLVRDSFANRGFGDAEWAEFQKVEAHVVPLLIEPGQ